MNRTDGIADSSLDMCTHALCGFDGNFHVPYVINRIENPENINACCGRMFHEFHNNIIRIMPVSYKVLAAKKHLERCFPDGLFKRPEPVPGVFIKIPDRRVKCRASPYLSLIHISEPTRLGMISYAVFCLK